MPWYRTGTVSITAGQNTVTGTSTAFTANARVGDAFLGPDGSWYEVTNIPSATVLSILPAYKGATVSGGTYAITPVQGYTKSLTDAANAVIQQWGSTLAGLGTVSTENVVPVAKGGTGGTTQVAARTGLGLTAAATATITSTADDMTEGRLLKVGDRGIGVGLSRRSTDDPASRVYLGGWDFSYVSSGVTGSTDGCMLTMNYGTPVYAFQIFGDWRTGALKTRSAVNSGAFSAWQTVYSTANTTRAADGTLKAI